MPRLLYNADILGDATDKTTWDDNSGAIGIFTINILAGLMHLAASKEGAQSKDESPFLNIKEYGKTISRYRAKATTGHRAPDTWQADEWRKNH